MQKNQGLAAVNTSCIESYYNPPQAKNYKITMGYCKFTGRDEASRQLTV